MSLSPTYLPDFEASCRICGASPCVLVVNHVQGDTDLCGPHFFADDSMHDWEDWNDSDDQDQPKEIDPDDFQDEIP